MFFLTFSNVWTFSVFFVLTYLMLILSIATYLLPIVVSPLRNTYAKNKTDFFMINSNDMMLFIATPFVIIVTISLLWSAPSTSAWFGHIVVSSFQLKMVFLVCASFLTVLGVFCNSVYFSSREIYDYLITKFHFFYWILLLFFSNSIFTTIFVIEVLSTLIFLLLITSTFSSSFFYRNTDLTYGNVFQNVTPYSYLQSILYFFWISLISSLNLFLFCLFFYFRILTFDWYLMEHVFLYFTSSASIKDIFSLGLSWFVLIFCIFLKCGVAPLYIWKPTFFKGIPFYTIFFYICFFYFFLFIFLIHLLTSYFSEVFYFFSFITLTFLFIGLFTLLFILCESYYFKAFLAISSILNSLFVLLALSSCHNIDTFFWL